MLKNMHLTFTNSVSNILDMESWAPEDIEALRRSHNLSRRAFSELLGVTGNYIYLLEKGVKTPSKTLKLLLDSVERELSNRKGGEKKHGKTHTRAYISSLGLLFGGRGTPEWTGALSGSLQRRRRLKTR